MNVIGMAGLCMVLCILLINNIFFYTGQSVGYDCKVLRTISLIPYLIRQDIRPGNNLCHIQVIGRRHFNNRSIQESWDQQKVCLCYWTLSTAVD